MTQGFPLIPPALPYGNGSWIVKRKATGEVIGEFFSADNVRKFNGANCEAIPIGEHLASLSQRGRAIAERDSALEQSGLQWQHDAESCGYRPGDSVAVLNALREQREARDAEIWTQFNNQ